MRKGLVVQFIRYCLESARAYKKISNNISKSVMHIGWMVLLLLHGIMWDTTISMAKLVCGLREDAEKVKQN